MDYKDISLFNNNNIKDENKIKTERIYRNINLQNVLIIFNEILNFMRNQDYSKAYKIVLNAFNLEDESFDKVNTYFFKAKIYFNF